MYVNLCTITHYTWYIHTYIPTVLKILSSRPQPLKNNVQNGMTLSLAKPLPNEPYKRRPTFQYDMLRKNL